MKTVLVTGGNRGIGLEICRQLDELGYTVILGQTATPPEKIEGELLCFGSCTRRYRKQGAYIAGCSPHFADVIEYLKVRKG